LDWSAIEWLLTGDWLGGRCDVTGADGSASLPLSLCCGLLFHSFDAGNNVGVIRPTRGGATAAVAVVLLPVDADWRLITTMPEQSNDYRVVVFGAGGVGKSSLVLRFVKGTFRESYIPTVEDTYRQVITCNKNNVCTLQITDTTGSHQFPAMQRLNISKGHAFIMVYSITSRQSLEELKPTWDIIHEIKGSLDNVPLMLVGNKCDETEARELSEKEGDDQAKRWGSHFMETSAKTNHNVKELFQELLSLDKNRAMSLQPDSKSKGGKSGATSGGASDKLKDKCLLM